MDAKLMDGTQAAETDHIPILDLSNLGSSDPQKRRELAQSVYDACTKVGFFYIKNHGVPESLITRVHDAAEKFFGLPEEKKMNFYIGNSKKYRGYSPIGGERSTGTDDNPVPKGEETGVLSEAFDIGYETAMELQTSAGYPQPQDIYGLYGDNQWPTSETLPAFAETYIQYCTAIIKLCRKLMQIFAIALDVPETFFDSKMKHPGVTSRMMHYPAQPVGDLREGLGAHTDWECFTILSQGKVPGLQILSHDGAWITASPIPGTLVVNIADCLSTWTNKKFKSTIHRVVNISGEERYSIPFFFGIDYDATVSVLENHTSEDNPPCREPFKAGEWVREKLSRAYLGYEGA